MVFKALSLAATVAICALPACAEVSTTIQTAAPATTAQTQDGVRIVDEVWHDSDRSRDVPVRVYLPAGQVAAPTVIVSHGLGGSREGLAYMGMALAQHGYVAVHVQHAGSDTDAARAGGGNPMQNLAAATRDPRVAINRFQDIPFAVDELLRRNGLNGELRGRIDGEDLAVLGHSFGAVTSLAIAGQRFRGGQTARDPRIEVAVALSPAPARQSTNAEAYGSIDIPVLMFTGTEDTSPIDDYPAERRQEPYAALGQAFRMLVVFDGADHGVFGGRARGPAQPTDAAIQAETVRITIAFLDRFLKRDPVALDQIEAAGSGGLRAPGVLRSAE